MPSEHCRVVFNARARSIGSLAYVPGAVQSVLASMPLPWEAVRYVPVAYHKKGILTIVAEKRKVGDEYARNWSTVLAQAMVADAPVLPLPLDLDWKFENFGVPDAFAVKNAENAQNVFSGKIKIRKTAQCDEIVGCKDVSGDEKAFFPFLYASKAKIAKFEWKWCGADGRALTENVATAGKVAAKRTEKHPSEFPLAIFPAFENGAERKKRHRKGQKTAKKLLRHRNFLRTELDWLEAGRQALDQGRDALAAVLAAKKIAYLFLDSNFNLVSKKPLKTKEKKKSRVGTAFHLTRELLKLLKMVVDLHFLFRTEKIDKNALLRNLSNLFTNVGVLTGIYRYKYRTMKQIRAINELVCAWKTQRSEAFCIWGEPWRIWLGWLRGNAALLQNYCAKLVARISGGRQKSAAKKVTKQRFESAYDKEWRERFLRDAGHLFGAPSAGSAQRFSKDQRKALLHLSEAWRCWKSHTAHSSGNADLDKAIAKFVADKAAWYVGTALLIQEKIARDRKIDKVALKKGVGKLARLEIKRYIKRQDAYISAGPFIAADAGVDFYKKFAAAFAAKNRAKIAFPKNDGVDETVLSVALENLRSEVKTERPSREDAEEAAAIDATLGNVKETLHKIRRRLLVERAFKEIAYAPTLESVSQKCACAYASVDVGGFDAKSADAAPRCAHALDGVFKSDVLDKITDAFLEQFLFFEAHNAALFPDYLKPRDAELDAQVLRAFCDDLAGLGPGHLLLQLKFENVCENVDLNLLARVLRLVIDPVLADYVVARNSASLGYKDINFSNFVGILKGLAFAPFVFMVWYAGIDAVVIGDDLGRLVKRRMRHLDRLYVVVDVSALENSGVAVPDGYEDFARAPGSDDFLYEESQARVAKKVGDAVTAHLRSRLHAGFGTMRLECASWANFSFSLCNFSVRFSLRKNAENAWQCGDFFVRLEIADEGMAAIKRRMNQILRSSTGATFYKTINKWNSAILALIARYREAVENTPEAEILIQKYERKIQNTIKIAINSKMPVRFPQVVFHAPRSTGGLGMFKASRTHSSDTAPNIRDYVKSWGDEIAESAAAYKIVRDLPFEKAKLLFGTGLPRISTRFQRNKNAALFDRGFRARAAFKKHNFVKENAFSFASVKHDGKLWDVAKYDDDVVAHSGGLEAIYAHTLHRALRLKNENLVFDEVVSAKQMTNAQRSGLNQIPNRRFILWWSPTINRAKVYVGYRTQLDQTGISMHGKLATVKISYVQIFRNRLWQNIQKSLVDALVRNFDYEIERCAVSAKKSVKIGDAAPDFVIKGVSSAVAVENGNVAGECACPGELWVDVQLRWCNYDESDIGAIAKDVFERHCSAHGFVVVFDLCFSRFSVHGRVPRDLTKLGECCAALLRTDAVVAVLRERIRCALGLHVDEPPLTNSNAEIFDADCVVHCGKESVFVFRPRTGALERVPIACGRKDFRKTVAALVAAHLRQSSNATGTVVIPVDIHVHLQSYLSEFPLLRIKTSETKMRFELLPRDLVDIYAGWRCSAYTGFCRVALVLASAAIDSEIIARLVPKWKMSDDAWIATENELKNVVVDDYAHRRFLDKAQITQSDLRDIVFGLDVHKSRKILFGDSAEVVPKRKILLSDWKSAFFYYEKNVDEIVASAMAHAAPESALHIPRNVVETVLRISDLQRPLFALVLENHRYAIPAQYSAYDAVYADVPGDVARRARGILLFNGTDAIFARLCATLGLENVPCVHFDTNCAPAMVADEGVFLVPKRWNCNFARGDLRSGTLALGVPQKFFADEFRTAHFREFSDSEKSDAEAPKQI